MDALQRLNELGVEEARAELLRCCGSSRWATAMTARRPFPSPAALFEAADAVWQGQDETAWREAFAHHPKIGDREALRSHFAATAAWADDEQSGARAVAEDVLLALALGNADYERRFGYIFIVCATGKTAPEMLGLLRERLANPPDDELRVAAGEQAKITRLRLQKLLAA
jgi:2-oxo-4-hydroxy-4-carboxy-5-ureidoimidazoline decarboxylase